MGLDAMSTWDGLLSGKGAIAKISSFDASGFPVQIAAEVPARDIDCVFRVPKLRKYSDRKVDMAVRASEEALAQAGYGPGASMPEPSRFGVSVGTEAGRPLLSEVASRYYRFKDYLEAGGRSADQLASVDPLEFVRTLPHLTATLLSISVNAQGPALTCSTACTSSAQALGEAAMCIRRGRADVMLAGGTDALVEAFMVTGFVLLGALSQRNDEPARASRPFDLARDGFVLGEGAGFVVLEDWDYATARGAEILAELVGYGCSSNAYRITDSPPDGRGARQSMVAALRDARIDAGEVDYINAHGTSTLMNDVSETRGIHSAFGDSARRLAVSSTKSMMGHLVAEIGRASCRERVLRDV
jgi:3-oxoacyl-[acyl-carrier-protein] synthase II